MTIINAEAGIEASATLPTITITRDFQATPAQLHRAHTDPEIYARWVGPSSIDTEIQHWDARTGGSWAYVSKSGDERYAFHGSFHDVTEDRIVQTFTYDDMPESVSLETMTFEDLGDGRTRLRAVSLLDSFESRDGMLASGMEAGIVEGYAKLDRLLADGEV
ncbi:SRPBCC family protein [Tsukamurella paurometabola]|uniref:SRPBCC family protein n=1 Tax=Tsukamurella paurometabola TaxID=2061 RepID=A0ABS5NH60_TSUPA|nr:SRPBCC family protein [Tsukamurella paurometabola]MBS4103622.1 SRPBCC family protein [Tsukamurella paurometabola]